MPLSIGGDMLHGSPASDYPDAREEFKQAVSCPISPNSAAHFSKHDI
jgi:hypothetical protein